MSRPLVACERCGLVLHHDATEKPQARLDRHAANGACLPRPGEKPKRKAKEPKGMTSLAEGWDW